MDKLNLLIELHYDKEMMYGDKEGETWFLEEVLKQTTSGEDNKLFLHSNLIGDSIGECKILKIEEVTA